MCHPDAPARLKKELDAVLDLQTDLEMINHTFQGALTAITALGSSTETAEVLASLEQSRSRFMDKVEILYNSLNVPDQFPELKGIDLEFVRTLLLARDLKINIRKRAIGSFFEWERLDRAVGGKGQPLGMSQTYCCSLHHLLSSRYQTSSANTQGHL